MLFLPRSGYGPYHLRRKQPDNRRLNIIKRVLTTCELETYGEITYEYDANGNEIRSYGYRPDSAWGTHPLWLKQNGQYYFYLNDHLGTPQKLLDTEGNTVWEARYDAFGKAEILKETVVNNLRFPGQYYDAETGLHYNFHRYYDPVIGRLRRPTRSGLTAGM